MRTLVLVGHAPSIPDLASGLTDGQGSHDAHVAMGKGYPDLRARRAPVCR